MDELKVKAGDELLYTYSAGGTTREKIVKVIKVTPTGRIRIDADKFQYNKYGDRMGEYSAWSGGRWLRKPTEEDYIRIKTNNTIAKAKVILQNIKIEDLTYEGALQIIEMFGEKE